MNISELIMRNPEGGTVDIEGDPLPDHGFFVGGAGTMLVFKSAEEIDTHLVDVWFKGQQSPYAGWWTDKDTGKVYVDWTTWYSSRGQAGFWAERRKEIAFWDINFGESVETFKTSP